MCLKLLVTSALLGMLILTSCVAGAPPSLGKATWFASCSIPVWGDVPVNRTQGTRPMFNEASRSTRLTFHNSDYNAAARYGIRITYGGPSAVPHAWTYRWYDGQGRNSWQIVFYGTPDKSLVRHELGHVYGLNHDYQGPSVMSPRIENPNSSWDNRHINAMRQTVGQHGC